MHRQSVRAPNRPPCGLGLDPAVAPRAGRFQRRPFIDQAAVTIAIDAGGRQITDPLDAGRVGDVSAVVGDHGIAVGAGWARHQNVRGPGQKLVHPGKRGFAVEDPGLDAARRQRRGPIRFPAGARNRPRLATKRLGETQGGIAEPKADQTVSRLFRGHGGVPQALLASRPGFAICCSIMV